MKTLGFALALALTGGAAQAGTVFEVPINGGIARIQLDDNCKWPVCASVSWTENARRQDRKEQYRKEPAKPSTSLKAEPPAKLMSSDPAPALGSTKPSVSSVAPSAPTPAPTVAGPADSGPNPEPPAMASHEPDANDAPAAPVPEHDTAAIIAPPQPPVSAVKASATSPVGEWMVEDGEARIRIEECGKNLCGVVSGAKNPNETDRKNPNPELRNRPIIGMPVLLDMKPANHNRWEGRIYNAKNGQTYTADISWTDPQNLRVEGCAFGGFICGGQNWTRVN
ncbi:MAG: DUF2147 domain-containing protein [Methylocella sp.]